MTKMQCFLRKSKAGANEILDYGYNVKKDIKDILKAIMIVMFMAVPLIIYLILLPTPIIPDLMWALIWLIVVLFIELIWIKCFVFPAIECLGSI